MVNVIGGYTQQTQPTAGGNVEDKQYFYSFPYTAIVFWKQGLILYVYIYLYVIKLLQLTFIKPQTFYLLKHFNMIWGFIPSSSWGVGSNRSENLWKISHTQQKRSLCL